MADKLCVNAGFDSIGYAVEQTANILNISSGRVRKLRDLHLLRPTPDSAWGKRERLTGVDIGFLASARNRPLVVDGPTLVCSMGVEEEHPFVPTLWFNGNTLTGLDSIRECEDVLSPSTLERVNAKELFFTGYWRVTDEVADALVGSNGLILASYTGFLLAGGRVVEEVVGVRRDDGARCFVVEPLQGWEQMKYTHNYIEPKQGPIVEYLEPEQVLLEVEEEFDLEFAF